MFELANCSVNAVCDVGSVIQESFVHLVKWKHQQSQEQWWSSLTMLLSVTEVSSFSLEMIQCSLQSHLTPSFQRMYKCIVVDNALPHYSSEVELF